MIEDDNRVLNYRGLDDFLQELKGFFIINPKDKATGKYLRCLNSDGAVEWASFPPYIQFIDGFNPGTGQIGNDPTRTLTKEAEFSGYMYIATTGGTLLGTWMDSGDAIIFKQDVAENVSITTSDFTYIQSFINVETSGQGITQNLAWNTEVTLAKVEGVSIKASLPANPNTDTQSDWNEIDTTSAAYINNKPTIPAAQVNSDWNSTSGVSEILNKPQLATVATSGAYSDLSGTPNLATVATSGSYNDLTNTPSIPAAQVQTDWNATTGMGVLLNKPSLATVATSGAYSDLSGTPSIPAAQIQSDWNQTNNVSLDYIKNKPIIPLVSDAAVILAAHPYGALYEEKFAQFSLNQAADTEIMFVAGSGNIILTPDLTNSKLLIDSKDTLYKFTIGSTTYGDQSGTSLGSLASETASSGGTTLSLVTTGEKYTWNNKGTVTSVSAGAGLVTADGNAITSSGTIKANLKTYSLVNLTSSLGDTPNRQYAVELDADGYLSVNVPWTDTVPTVNDATYSIKTDVSGTETTVSDFTANQATADSVTFVQGSNVTLTPDATNKKITIAATNTTYSAGEGISINNNVISLDNQLTEITLNDASDYNDVVQYTTSRYKIIHLTASGEGNVFNLKVNTANVTNGPKEIIYRIDAVTTTGLNITLVTGDSGILEAYSAITSVDNPVEIVFTFWKTGLVTYNGGTNI